MSEPSENAAYNEQTKLLATCLNNVAVAFIVIGVITPITAVSFGIPNAPPLSFGTAAFAILWFWAGVRLTLGREKRSAERQTVNSGQIFVTFVIPAFVLAAAYVAMLLNERAGKRLDRKPPGE